MNCGLFAQKKKREKKKKRSNEDNGRRKGDELTAYTQLGGILTLSNKNDIVDIYTLTSLGGKKNYLNQKEKKRTERSTANGRREEEKPHQLQNTNNTEKKGGGQWRRKHFTVTAYIAGCSPTAIQKGRKKKATEKKSLNRKEEDRERRLKR